MGIFLASLTVIVLLFFVGLITYLLRDAAKSTATKQCTACAKRVKRDAVKCRHCGKDLSA